MRLRLKSNPENERPPKRRKRREINASPKKGATVQRKRLGEAMPEVDPTPDRPAPKWLKVGPKQCFKTWELRKVGNLGIDKVYDTYWIAMYGGPGYVDLDRVGTKKGAQSLVSMFKLRYPRIEVEWLKGDLNVEAGNEVRESKSNANGSSSASERKRKWERVKQRRLLQTTVQRSNADDTSTRRRRRRSKS